jgi:hypothetical protein
LRIADEVNVGARGAAVDVVERRRLICGYLEIEQVEKLTTNLEVERLVQLELLEHRKVEKKMNSLPTSFM